MKASTAALRWAGVPVEDVVQVGAELLDGAGRGCGGLVADGVGDLVVAGLELVDLGLQGGGADVLVAAAWAGDLPGEVVVAVAGGALGLRVGALGGDRCARCQVWRSARASWASLA